MCLCREWCGVQLADVVGLGEEVVSGWWVREEVS